MTFSFLQAAALVSAFCFTAVPVAADMRIGGKIMLTRGVTTVEGTAGGGIASWALITGNQSRDGVGASAFGSYVALPDFDVGAYGVGVGLFERAEITFARQNFNTGETGALLGIGEDFTFSQNIIGAKVRLMGDAIYDQDSWLPQIAVGLQHKRGNQEALVQALGAEKATGTDFYLTATKLILDPGILVSGAVRLTKANQTGLLGFGGDRNSGHSVQFEGSIGWLATRWMLIGAEYRTKPNNLGFAEENDWLDIYAAFALGDHITVTAAYVDLGSIATFDGQRGGYVSFQAGF